MPLAILGEGETASLENWDPAADNADRWRQPRASVKISGDPENLEQPSIALSGSGVMRTVFPANLKLIGLLVISLAGTANAGSLLDQSFVRSTFSADYTIYSLASISQTFTVGLAGLLSQVDLQIYKNTGATGDLTFEILATSGGVPVPDSTPPLFQTVIPLSSLPTIDDPNLNVHLTSVEVSSAGIIVTPGEVLGLALRSPHSSGSPPWTAWRSGPDQYPRGAEYIEQNNATSWSPLLFAGQGQDGGFQTWVASVPEPSSIVLLLPGLLGVATCLFRRR
jgi:hypothetical protein